MGWSAQGLRMELGHSGLIGLILVSVVGVVLGKGSFSISVRLTPAFASPVRLFTGQSDPGDPLPVFALF